MHDLPQLRHLFLHSTRLVMLILAKTLIKLSHELRRDAHMRVHQPVERPAGSGLTAAASGVTGLCITPVM
jgi:hypothetical protein